MIGVEFSIVLFIICLIFSGFFSGAEVALISINQAKVRTLVEEGHPGARALHKLKKNQDHLLITILIGNNLANIGAAALATSVAIEQFGDIGVGIATGVVTLLMLVFGEIGPKTYAARFNVGFALIVSRPVLYLSYIFSPFIWIFDSVKKIFRVKGDMTHPMVTEEEIKQWIDVGEESGTIQEEEHEMLYRVFRFTDTVARETMTPRGDVIMIEDTSSLEDSIEIFNETGFSRIPVYHDQKENIIGIINVKDAFAAVHAHKDVPISTLMYDVHFVPESKKIDELLKELQKRKVHIAVVVDEYGSFAGIITVEDILEELVGEIMDEFDEEEPQIQELEDRVYLVDAQVWVDRINSELEITLPVEEGYETLGGLIIERLGHIPRRGEVVEIEDSGIQLHVMKMHGRRIEEVKLILLQNENDLSE